MFEITAKEKPTEKIGKQTHNPIQRLTAFWAFSEAGLGGVLHITKLPFKGIFIAGAATLFISLIAKFSKERGRIIKSSVLVIVVKFLVSPHTPITAAIAVFAQGLFGEIFFFSKRLNRVLIPAYAMFIQFITAVQKILIITILFGQKIWMAVDNFTNSILNQFMKVERIEFSSLIIIAYIVIHVLVGLFLGFFILRLSNRLEATDLSTYPKPISDSVTEEFSVKISKHKKHWFQKPSGIAVMIFLLVLLAVSFFLPEWAESNITDIILMIVRAIIIIALWYYLISPILRKIISKIVSEQKMKHFKDIDHILQFFPLMKQIVILSWNNSKGHKGIKRVENFLFNIIQYTLAR
jgi:hypothetical protein